MTELLLEEGFTYLLMRVCKFYRSHAHSTMDKLGLYRGQGMILKTLWEEDGLTHSELAERLIVQPATITNAVKRLEHSGLVQRRHDDADQRISHVYLTDAGRALREPVTELWEKMEQCIVDGFTLEEQALLRRFLLRVSENLQVEPGQCT